jgi:ABC-2 type transport system ATP-binding protein
LNATPAVRVQNLTKSYTKGVPVLKGIALEVARGEIFGFLGPNGSGKTTTLEILEGFIPADGGQVEVLGLNPIRETAQLKARVGTMLQETSLFQYLTTREILEFFAQMYPNPFPVAQIMETFQLDHQAKTRIARLSGGQRRKLDMALAIIGRPELVFLDEPTTGFDPHARREAWETIRQMRAMGSTIFLTTQLMDEAEALCDRVAILRAGEIIAMDAPLRLKSQLKLPVTIRFATNPRLAPAQFAGLTGIQRVAEEDGNLALTTTDADQTMREIYRLVDEAAASIQNLQMQSPSLEEVFLSLTERQPQNEGGKIA